MDNPVKVPYCSRATKNYSVDNGDTLVIGGKLKVLPEAVVEGLDTGGGADPYVLPAATTEDIGGVKQAEYLPDSAGENLLALVGDYNKLLAKLRAAGIMASS